MFYRRCSARQDESPRGHFIKPFSVALALFRSGDDPLCHYLANDLGLTDAARTCTREIICCAEIAKHFRIKGFTSMRKLQDFGHLPRTLSVAVKACAKTKP